jgi:C4-dicarboxylate-specific signal transduction histidine kinase
VNEVAMSIEEAWNRYCACLREKAQSLDDFESLANETKRVWESGNTSHLNGHLEARQSLISRMEQIDKELQTFTDGNGSCMEEVSGKAKNLVQHHLGQIRTALERLAAMDKECLALARAHHDSMKSEILKVRHGFRAARGYRLAVEHHPKFLDVKR